MTSVQRFFTQHSRPIVIAMTALVAIGSLANYALHLTGLANWLYGIVGAVGLIPLVIKAIASLKYRVISIELLVSVAIIGAMIIGEYSEAGIVAWLFLLGEAIENATIARTRSAIRELTELAPQRALLLDSPADRAPRQVDVDDIDRDDYVLVKAGSQIPVDGRIVFGSGHIDEASITGEPMPRSASAAGSKSDSKPDSDKVFAGTTLTDGTMVVQASRVGEDTVFGKILTLVEEAQDAKTPAQRFIDRFAKYYTPVVLLTALAVGVATLDVHLAITILVLGCPGALVIGIPVSNVAGIGLGARHGVLAKGAQVLHTLSSADVVVFDKTGTLTTGEPRVRRVLELGDAQSSAAGWRYAASVERESSHPLAAAVLNAAVGEHHAEPGTLPTVEHTQVVAGQGIIAQVEGHRIAVGNDRLMAGEDVRPSAKLSAENLTATLTAWGAEGLTPVLIAVDGRLAIALGVGDTVRQEAAPALTRLRRQGIRELIMLSGDSQSAVSTLGQRLGVDEARGGLLPQDKAAHINSLRSKGHTVAFVGDGINDSPALAAADIGIAMGGGTSSAVDISDVVLLNSDIARLPTARAIARATVANTRENIVIALATVALLVTGLFAGLVTMASGMLVHEASILIVVINALRLLRRNIDGGQVAAARRQIR